MAAMENDQVTFNVWHDGDSSVGIPGDQATVQMYVGGFDPEDQKEYIELARGALREAFSGLWDTRAHVATDQELESKEAAIEHQAAARYSGTIKARQEDRGFLESLGVSLGEYNEAKGEFKVEADQSAIDRLQEFPADFQHSLYLDGAAKARENEIPQSRRQLATVLAALRYWQREGVSSSGHEHDIANDGGAVQPLAAAEIDALCERLNADAELASPGISASLAEFIDDLADCFDEQGCYNSYSAPLGFADIASAARTFRDEIESATPNHLAGQPRMENDLPNP